MRFTALLVAASFVYSSAAMPTKLAVESKSFNSVGAAADNVEGIVSGTTVDGFQMSSAEKEAYSPPSPPVLCAESVVYQSTLTSDLPSVSPLASQIVVFPTLLAISCPPAPSTVIPVLTFVNPNATASATVSVPFRTNGTMRRVRGHSTVIFSLVFVYAVLQSL